jgi:hypothetical protein
MSKSVFCIAQTQEMATRIIESLKSAGFQPSEISTLLPDKLGNSDFAHEQHSKLPEGATTGVGIGGLLGGGLGWLVGVGSLAIPGLGTFIAAGPILAMLSGAAAGAAIGGVSGALIGLGMPEYEAKRYEGKIRGGNILISVHTHSGSEIDRAKAIFENAGAEDIAYTEDKKPSDKRSAA